MQQFDVLIQRWIKQLSPQCRKTPPLIGDPFVLALDQAPQTHGPQEGPMRPPIIF
jgi:hypothetical protein